MRRPVQLSSGRWRAIVWQPRCPSARPWPELRQLWRYTRQEPQRCVRVWRLSGYRPQHRLFTFVPNGVSVRPQSARFPSFLAFASPTTPFPSCAVVLLLCCCCAGGGGAVACAEVTTCPGGCLACRARLAYTRCVTDFRSSVVCVSGAACMECARYHAGRVWVFCSFAVDVWSFEPIPPFLLPTSPSSNLLVSALQPATTQVVRCLRCVDAWVSWKRHSRRQRQTLLAHWPLCKHGVY